MLKFLSRASNVSLYGEQPHLLNITNNNITKLRLSLSFLNQVGIIYCNFVNLVLMFQLFLYAALE